MEAQSPNKLQTCHNVHWLTTPYPRVLTYRLCLYCHCVPDVKKLKITGTTVVEEGDALNLTCSIESFPPSRIKWTKPGSKKETETDPESATGTATLVIHNMTAGYSGEYICTAIHLNKSLTEKVDVTVKCKFY